MKKLLIALACFLVLAGCNTEDSQKNVLKEEYLNQKSPTAQTALSNYRNEDLNIYFSYPLDWTVQENDKSVTITSPVVKENAGNSISIKIPSESFDEYENEMKDLIAAEKMSVNNNSPVEGADYNSKEYGQEGWLYYIIKINDKYVSIGSEKYLTENEKVGLKNILSSLSF